MEGKNMRNILFEKPKPTAQKTLQGIIDEALPKPVLLARDFMAFDVFCCDRVVKDSESDDLLIEGKIYGNDFRVLIDCRGLYLTIEIGESRSIALQEITQDAVDMLVCWVSLENERRLLFANSDHKGANAAKGHGHGE
jgi:hypothetical protein